MTPQAAIPHATRTSACDLHVHSKHSDRPSEWILRRIGSPESFMEPREIYRRCKAQGMQFVTITDHNSIAGALEIAEYPDTFLSAELTTYFPEDGCKIHCLVAGITEAQFAELDRVRKNIYDLREYLVENNIIHSIAHPLFRVNGKLTVEHVEKLVVLFNRFEGVNGTRHPRASELTNVVLRNLTPERIAELATRHGITPQFPEPWRKTFTGGSDDHGGCYVAQGFTVTPHAATVGEFLEHLRAGRHAMGGSCGTSLKFAHSLYTIAHQYYRQRVLRGRSGDTSAIGALLHHFAEGTPRPNSWRGTISYLGGKLFGRSSRQTATERLLVQEFSAMMMEGGKKGETMQAEAVPGMIDDRRAFQFACKVGHQLGFTFLKKFIGHMRNGELLESLEAFSALGPVALGISPYFASFASQHKDEEFLQAVAARFPAASGLVRASGKKVWVTDSFSDGTGVARTIETFGTVAKRIGRELTVVTCQKTLPNTDIAIKNFIPVGTFQLPEYEAQEMAFPPFLEMLHYFEEERFSEVIISTPGPVGLAALAVGRLLGLRVTGVYHIDFPMYARYLTQDDIMENATWRYMRWFFGQLDTVFVPSDAYKTQLAGRGFDEDKLRVMPCGVDVEQFNLDECALGFMKEYGVPVGGVNYLYVGRISVEANLDVLLAAFAEVRTRLPKANLILTGDGPHLPVLMEKWGAENGVYFTGELRGQALIRAYAGADIFVQPGTADTFSTVVLEAQACGLPVIIAASGDRGIDNALRLVVDMGNPGALARAMELLASDPTMWRDLSVRGLQNARHFSVTASVEMFWQADAASLNQPRGDEYHSIQFDPAAAAASSLQLA